jgi:hypothetical protein
VTGPPILIRIDDQDFNWQSTYDLEKPIDLPKRSVVTVLACFGSSATDLDSNPPREARLGKASVMRSAPA